VVLNHCSGLRGLSRCSGHMREAALGPFDVAAAGSAVRVLVVRAREEWAIARGRRERPRGG
jgi:acetate kinase